MCSRNHQFSSQVPTDRANRALEPAQGPTHPPGCSNPSHFGLSTLQDKAVRTGVSLSKAGCPGALWMLTLSRVRVALLYWCKIAWASWPQEQKTNPAEGARETGTTSCVNVGTAHCSQRVDGWAGGVALSTAGALRLFPHRPCWEDRQHSQLQELCVPTSWAGVLTVKCAFKISLLDNYLMFFHNTGTAKLSFLFSVLLWETEIQKLEGNIDRPHKQHFLLLTGVKSVLSDFSHKLEDRSSNKNKSGSLSPGLEYFSSHICTVGKKWIQNHTCTQKNP